MDKNDDASLNKLQADGRITAEQAKAYKDYHAKQKQVKLLQIKAFTMLESLLVLGLVSILGLGLSGSVSPVLQR